MIIIRRNFQRRVYTHNYINNSTATLLTQQPSPQLHRSHQFLYNQTKQYRHFSSHHNDILFNPSEEHGQLRDMIRSFAEKEVDKQAAEHDESGTLNRELLMELGKLGLLGITIPTEAGGAEMDTVAATLVHHELAKYDVGFTLAYLAHAILFVNNFYHCSTETQRCMRVSGHDDWFTKVISGEWIGAMGMTEPNAGTDVLGMGTTAVRNGDEYILNGSKTYITNAIDAQVFLVYAKVDGRITSFLVDRSLPGFSTADHHIDKCGMRASTMAELYFEDCRVPVTHRLGEEGSGVVHMMRNLEIERLCLAAMSVGIADRCVDIMVKWANDRQAFGERINRFGQIQRYIGESYAMTEAAKALVYSVARSVGPNVENRIGSDAAKLFAAPVGKIVADNAMQVLGGIGYCKEMPVERLWRDAKLLEIGGGTNEAHQKNITKDLTKKLL